VIAGEKTSEMGLVVAVELQNFPHDLELTGEPVNAVEVRLRASPGIIQRITPGDVSARVDLAGVGEGEHIVHLSAESIRVPFGVRVVRVNPATLALNFERTLQKTVPVRARLMGRPAPGYEVAQVASRPGEVPVAGPKTRVQEVESAFTEPVSVEGASAAVTDEVNIGLDDPLLRVLGSPRVTVTAEVREAAATRSFPGVEVAVRGGAGSPQPARVDVVLAGPASILQRVDRSQVKAYVDLARAQAGAAPVAAEVEGGPAGVTVKSLAPDRVSVRPARRGR
ncbi:MAG TPA: CdaR family protein, partial [Vicinamibacteria bacterium]|nr:CdaR family protein [Vicinamibacteria bacterium]